MLTHVGEHYAQAVERYLSSDRGQDTGAATRRRLGVLDPTIMGFEPRHGEDAVHALRVALDVLEESDTGLRPVARALREEGAIVALVS